MVLYLRFINWIDDENFKTSLLQLNSFYVTYLGVIITFYFTNQNKDKTKEQQSGMPFILALISSGFWNIIIFVFIFRIVLELALIEESINHLNFFVPLLSWFVAPAIGYYFAKENNL